MNRGFIGCCGSGKTYALQESVRDALDRSPWCALVLDVNGEWPDMRVFKGFRGRIARVKTPEAAAKKLALGVRLVVYQPDLTPDEMASDAPCARVANEAARFAISVTGNVTSLPRNVALDGPPTVLVLPEAHQSMREGKKMPPYLGVILHRWRHKQTLLWWDTQNVRDVKKEAFDLSGVLNVFALAGPNDVDRLREWFGRPCAEAAQRVTCEAEPNENGCKNPGWHLRVNPQALTSSWTAYRVTKGELSEKPVR